MSAQPPPPQQRLYDEFAASLRDLPAATAVLECFWATLEARHECKTAERLLRLFVTELRQPRRGLDGATLQAAEDRVVDLLAEGHWRQGYSLTRPHMDSSTALPATFTLDPCCPHRAVVHAQ